MSTFRKKPVEIEARLFAGNHVDMLAVSDWCEGNLFYVDPISDNEGVLRTPEGYTLAIDTLEGTMTATYGDWIIRGVSGEFYPCKPDIFELTYELVEN